MIVPIKCMPKISAVGLFCLDKFENNQTKTCTTFFRASKLTEVYFNRLNAFRLPNRELKEKKTTWVGKFK